MTKMRKRRFKSFDHEHLVAAVEGPLAHALKKHKKFPRQPDR
jgi:hypothetical protein